jgi:hypothetical protein
LRLARWKWREELIADLGGADALSAQQRTVIRRRQGEMGRGQLVWPNVEKTTFAELADMLTTDYRANKRRSLDRIEGAVAHLNRGVRGRPRRGDHRGQCDGLRCPPPGGRRGQRDRQPRARGTQADVPPRRARREGRPTAVYRAPPERNARSGFFEPDPFRAVLRHLPDYLQGPASVAYITGWRFRSEILSRQKRHVDLSNGWLRLDANETKNDEGRMFPFTPSCAPS